MPFNLLLFPLVGGYYIFVRFLYFRYLHHKSESERLILNSVICGIAVLVATYALRLAVEAIFPELIRQIWLLLPAITGERYIGTSLACLVVAVGVTELVNFIYRGEDKKKYLRNIALRRAGNELELLFAESANKKKPVQITLSSDKVYVGWITELPIPSLSTYVRVLPVISGYRDEEKQLIFTTDYSEVYAHFIRKKQIKDIEDLQTDIVVPISEIITANLFDVEVYEQFNQQPQPAPGQPAVP